MKRCFLLLLITLCAAGIPVFAQEVQGADDSSAATVEFSVWEDGVTADILRRGNVAEVTLTAPDGSGGYSYPYLYRYGEYDLTGYQAYICRIRNTGTDILRLNFTLTDLAGIDYRVGNGDSVIVMREGASIPELLFPDSGMLELEFGFEGEIRIPIDNVPRASLKNVVSYGVTIAVPAGNAVSFELSDLQWSSGLASIPRFRLNGPAELQIPAMGEAAARYTADFGDADGRYGAVFSLDGEPEDVLITEDGVLTVGGGAKTGTVKISVSADGLVKSGTTLTLLEKRQDFPFPQPGGAGAQIEDPFFSAEVLNGLRIACAAVAIYLAVLYLLWKTAEQGDGE